MEKNKTKHLVGCIICGLLTLVGVIGAVISLIEGIEGPWFICTCVQIIVLILLTFYAFVGYKKPHGNLLKYTMLIYAIFIITYIPCYVTMGLSLVAVLATIEIGIVCYVAGRLARIKQNIFLLLIITCIELYFNILDIIDGYLSIATVGPLAIWIDICVAYFLRYKEHREAGLVDGPITK